MHGRTRAPGLFTTAMRLMAVALVGYGLLGTAAQAAGSGGAGLYREHCAVCHGDKGDGNSRAQQGLNPPPRDFTTAEAWEQLSRERMLTSVSYGRPDTAMMAFSGRLDAAQIASVVDYVRTAFMHRPTATRQDNGARLYKKHCAACHGDGGAGATWTQNSLNPPPRNFTATSPDELTAERMVTSVTHGRPGTAMMAFSGRLSEQEILAVVGFVRATFMHVTSGPAAPVGTAAVTRPDPLPRRADLKQLLPQGLIGQVEAGRLFYQENCATCHGLKGDGNGPRAGFIQPPPRNFTSRESRLTMNRPALFAAISQGKRGTVMPAWSAVLSDQQIADVAEYVFRTYITAEKKTLN
ncbi:MAG: c-type cytochrome [Gammaproteobacteria bacterium]|nr:c-type cytochrome [Gammaproteobacteria bacterium]